MEFDVFFAANPPRPLIFSLLFGEDGKNGICQSMAETISQLGRLDGGLVRSAHMVLDMIKAVGVTEKGIAEWAVHYRALLEKVGAFPNLIQKASALKLVASQPAKSASPLPEISDEEQEPEVPVAEGKSAKSPKKGKRRVGFPAEKYSSLKSTVQ